MLSEIAHEQHVYLSEYPDAIQVREKALETALTSMQTICALHKVVGVSDLYAWASGKKEFQEVAPVTVKTVLTQNRSASKDEVAAAQEPYVGKQDYFVDDESDAVAVGITWQIKNKYIDKKS